MGCGPGIFLLQNIVNYFVTRGSSVYITALDASKAFDRVDHSKLFDKLIKRGTPYCFVGVLRDWYGKLYCQVRWNGYLSSMFTVTCGVRQGGVLSPLLFNVYTDELIDTLMSSNCGCHIGKQFYGCLMYADDIILLSPSLSGMQHLMDICSDYAKLHYLVFNNKKTVCCVITKYVKPTVFFTVE